LFIVIKKLLKIQKNLHGDGICCNSCCNTKNSKKIAFDLAKIKKKKILYQNFNKKLKETTLSSNNKMPSSSKMFFLNVITNFTPTSTLYR